MPYSTPEVERQLQEVERQLQEVERQLQEVHAEEAAASPLKDMGGKVLNWRGTMLGFEFCGQNFDELPFPLMKNS